MNTRSNQRWKNSEEKMQEALLSFMEHELEPSVGDICKAAEVNRSTFYRHYLDIYDLMEKTELAIQRELVKVMQSSGLRFDSKELTADALLPMVEFIGRYRNFYRSYLKTHLDASMEAGIETVWEGFLKPLFRSRGVKDETHMLYYFQYFKAGILSMLKLWLDRDCADPPEEVAKMIEKILNRP